MRLEPVYLVAPRKKPPTISSRRAFLGMGLAFVCGGAIGSACGYSVAAAKGAKDMDATEDGSGAPLVPSGNPDLDQIREAAVKSPIEDLAARAIWYLAAIGQDYRDDEIAWSGLPRLVHYVVNTPTMKGRRLVASGSIQIIETATAAMRAKYESLLPELRGVR